ATTEYVVRGCTGNAGKVEGPFVVEVFVVHGHGRLFYVAGYLIAWYGNALYGVVILPQDGLAGAVVVGNTATEIIAGDILNLRQVFTEVSKYADGSNEDHDDADAGDLETHDEPLAAEPIMHDSLRVHTVEGAEEWIFWQRT